MTKITRKGQVVIFAVISLLFLVLAFYLFQPKQEKAVKPDTYAIALVAENQAIKATYEDAISSEKSSTDYQEYQMVIKAGTKINNYPLSNTQSFSKYLKPEGPDGKTVLSQKSKDVVTHYAYTLLLTGDIQEKINLRTKEKTYEIVNARVTYDRIPIILLPGANSVTITNTKKNKVKVLNFKEFQDVLSDVDKRDKIINWS